MARDTNLLGRQGLDGKGGEDHVFNAEAGVDGVEPLIEESCEMARIPARASGAKAKPLDPAIDPMESEVEPPRSRPFPRQAADEIRREPLRRQNQMGGLGNRL